MEDEFFFPFWDTADFLGLVLVLGSENSQL